MIRYRLEDYKAHVERWAETDPVEPFTPIKVRAMLAAYAAILVRTLGDRTAPTFCDAGCRLGWLADFFRDSPVAYEGFDVNRDAVAKAQALGRNVGLSPTRDRYSIVFARQVLQYTDDLPGLVRGLEALVEPGGLLCLVQSVPWEMVALHHFNACDSVEDILACLTLPVGHVAPLAGVSDAATMILARRPA